MLHRLEENLSDKLEATTPNLQTFSTRKYLKSLTNQLSTSSNSAWKNQMKKTWKKWRQRKWPFLECKKDWHQTQNRQISCIKEALQIQQRLARNLVEPISTQLALVWEKLPFLKLRKDKIILLKVGKTETYLMWMDLIKLRKRVMELSKDPGGINHKMQSTNSIGMNRWINKHRCFQDWMIHKWGQERDKKWLIWDLRAKWQRNQAKENLSLWNLNHYLAKTLTNLHFWHSMTVRILAIWCKF